MSGSTHQPRFFVALWVHLTEAFRSLLLDGFFLALILAALLAPVSGWVARAQAPPAGDDAHHLLALMAFEESLDRADSPLEWLAPSLVWWDHNAYPPLFYLATGQVAAWLGVTDLEGRACLNGMWAVLLVLGVYLLGRGLFEGGGEGTPERTRRGRLLGLSAAFLVAFLPPILRQFPRFLLDLPATAMLTLALGALAWARGLESSTRALLATVAVAAAALTKWTTLFGLIPALIFVVCEVFGRLPREERARLGRSLLILLLALGGVMAWSLQGEPPRSEPELAVHYDYVFLRLVSMGAIMLVLGTWRPVRPRPGPALNMLQAGFLLVALLLPFYSISATQLWDIFFNECTTEVVVRSGFQAQVLARVAESFTLERAQEGLMLVGFGVALIGLFFSGTRASLGVLALPFLAFLGATWTLRLPDERYYLPALPLGVLIAVAALVGWRPVRLPGLLWLLALGTLNMWNWVCGTLPTAHLATVPVEGPPLYRNAWLGDAPESANPRMEALAEEVARQLGPEPRAIAVLSPSGLLTHQTLQATFLAEGHPYLVRRVKRSGASRARPGNVWAVRFLQAVCPELPLRRLRRLSEAPLNRLEEPWLLVLARRGQRIQVPRFLAHRLGESEGLPAPLGFQATLYSLDSSGPEQPSSPHG